MWKQSTSKLITFSVALTMACVAPIALLTEPAPASQQEDEPNDGEVTVTSPCKGIEIESLETFEFSDAEQKLICGDKDSDAWSDVPPAQAGYFIRTFLQSRGYHRVETRITEDGLYVDAGKKTYVADVMLAGTDVALDVDRYWEILGRPLTPESLTQLENWILQELKRNGVACPVMELSANPVTGVVTVEIERAPKTTFPEVEAEAVPGLIKGISQRYFAFHEGELYDSMLLDLTARRMIQDEIVLNSHFITRCHDDGTRVEIEQKIMAGEPRLVSFGFGFDTEEFLIARALWRNNRFGNTASGLEVSGFASYRTQRAQVLFDWYYAPIVTRHFLRSVASYERRLERQFETLTWRVRSGPAWEVDLGGTDTFYWLAPSYEFTEVVRGEGPSTTGVLSLFGEIKATTHDYEFYQSDPRSGTELDLQLAMTRKNIGSEITANRYGLQTTHLWNLFELSPPIWILGARTSLSATQLGADTGAQDLPPNYRYFLGGSDDLRGFGLNRLPPNDIGSLTSAYLGVESRVSNVLPYNVQPIAFVDSAKIGREELTLDPSVFWSPGLGVHWQSPIGTFRTTFAHGFINGKKREPWSHMSRWQFYLSYGEQF